jgi:hypothetical protein
MATTEVRSPLAPLKKGGTGVNVPWKKGETEAKVPLKKGDLGGAKSDEKVGKYALALLKKEGTKPPFLRGVGGIAED